MTSTNAAGSVLTPGANSGLILQLTTINAAMVPDVGGKAANLGELIQAGFAVPQGFCVTTEAYRLVLDGTGFENVLHAADRLAPDDAAGLTELATRARKMIATAPVPGQVSDAVLDAYAALGEQAMVAVRSSATAEDLPYASFAGQQDTYLGVVGAEQVLDAVRRCWASLWTERAVTYRNTQGIDHRTARLAVVVQKMVQSDVAGVLFTANPVTGRRREAVIDASPGLGEAVVSGAVTPDHLVVDTASGRVLSSRNGARQFAIRAVTGGGTERVELEPEGGLCLNDTQTHQLVQLGDRVEQHFGRPQDIEWAFDELGQLWLTQSRAITTLYPVPDAADRQGLRVYFNFTVAQGLYRPITPMGLSVFRLLGTGAVELLGGPQGKDPLDGPPILAVSGLRLFLDLTNVVRSRVGREIMPRVFDLMETRSATIMRGLFDRPEFSVIERSPRKAVRRLARIALRYRVPVTALRALVNPTAAHHRISRVGDELAGRLAVPADATPIQRLDHAVSVLHRELVPVLPTMIPGALTGLAMLGLASRLLRGVAAPGEIQGVLRGVPNNVTTEMDLLLWELAQRIRSDRDAAEAVQSRPPAELARQFLAGSLPTTLQGGLTEFLGRYGHRAVAEIDVGIARWAEDPTHILGVLANYLHLDDPALAPDTVFARSSATAEKLIQQLARAAGRRSRWRAPVIRFALGRARALIGIREMPKFFLVLGIAAARRDLSVVGAALAEAGRLDQADDVFFVTLAEARAALSGRSLQDVVARNRSTYEQELRRRRVPRVLLSDGTEPENIGQVATGTTGALTGVAASPGIIAGVARVILDPVGAHLDPGEILVAPSTDPGWTPLFLTAGGLVMEMGGSNSHGAVVAREYGIPAVVGLPFATDRISTGDRLRVDGTSGTVTIERP